MQNGCNMPNANFHFARRQQLRQDLTTPILLMGNAPFPNNFPANQLPFRQDSSFWYLTGCTHPNAAWFSWQDEDILFLPDVDADDALWHGPQSSPQEIAVDLRFDRSLPISQLPDFIERHVQQGHFQRKEIQSLSVPNEMVNQQLSQWIEQPLSFGRQNGSDRLIDWIIQHRRILSEVEISAMKKACAVTHRAHLAAMKATKTGLYEQDIAAAFHFEIQRVNMSCAYHSIVTVDGHILHNHHYHNKLCEGQLLLLDGGAQSHEGYASDVTRTWPVSGKFSQQQAAAYDAVLKAQEAAIAMVRPGMRYGDIHRAASLLLAEFLVDEKLLRISPAEAVEIGAHALFFPHGIGHLLGMDVHDMENFGDRVSYPAHRKRSSQFGTGYLRLDLDLEENMVVTIEPGFYIVPAILNNSHLRTVFKDAIYWDHLDQWTGFGGIRIEDDIRVATEPENLTALIPKSITDLENLISQT